jgi:hypothetical protein
MKFRIYVHVIWDRTLIESKAVANTAADSLREGISKVVIGRGLN